MSQDYKFKFDHMRESQPGEPEKMAAEEFYQSGGYIRNIAFVQPNGKMRSFNYAYLVSHEFDPEQSTIMLEFTTHTVLIKGYNLEKTYFELFDQRNRILYCVDKRYSALNDEDGTIFEITIKKN